MIAGTFTEFADTVDTGLGKEAVPEDETAAAAEAAGALNVLRKPSRRKTGSSLSVARKRNEASAHTTEQ